jgi:hypothetical protein
MPADACLHAGETFGVARGLTFVVAHVNVNERRARLEGFVRGLDLLVDADRNRRVLRLLRQ